jgi:hypothetical protein
LASNQPIGTGCECCGIKRRRRHDLGLVNKLGAAVKTQRHKIAQSPRRQFAKPPELVRIVAPPLVGCERSARLLQLDEGTRRLPAAGEGKIRSPHPADVIFGQNSRWDDTHLAEHRFDERPEPGRDQQFESCAIVGDSRIRGSIGAHGGCKLNKKVAIARRADVPNRPRHVGPTLELGRLKKTLHAIWRDTDKCRLFCHEYHKSGLNVNFRLFPVIVGF